MQRHDGPHTRNQLAGASYRGSRKRIARLDAFDELPINFWLVIGIAATMLAMTIVMLYRAL